MKKIILILILVVFISGCAEKECKISDDCLTKTCFNMQCKNNNCVYSPVYDCCGNDKCEQEETYESCSDDCLNCDDANECTKDSYDYHEQKCVNAPILDVACCGNGVCEVGETYASCAKDCPNCDDDNKCTKDSYDSHEQTCINELIVPCCGNDICDDGVETYLNCPTDCPNCDDDDELTGDSFNYVTQECENTGLLIKKDIEDYKYVKSVYGGGSPGELELYSEEGEQIGVIKCGVALYKNSIGQEQIAVVCPYNNRQDATNSLEGMSIKHTRFVLGEYKGEKVYWVDKEMIVWTSNVYILVSGTEPGSGVLPEEVIVAAYLNKYPNDLG